MSILDREYFLTIDLYNATVSKNKKEIKFYNTDRNTSILYVDVIDHNEDGSTKYLSSDDLIGLTLNLNAIRPKTIDVENAIGIIDESFKDYVVYKFELPLSFTGQAGEVILEFSFSDMKENGERLTIDSTHYTVKRSKLTDLNEAISTNEDKNILEELIAQVQTVKNINDNTPSDIETYSSNKIENILTYKVSKEEGRGLSTNDLTNELKTVYDNAKTEVENARGAYNSLKDRLDNSDTQFNTINTKISYIFVEDFGAKGDGNTDDTIAFQNAMDYASSKNKTICLLNKTYALTALTLKANASITSNEYTTIKILESNNQSFIKIDEGAITNLNYSACIENLFIKCNANNLNQKIIDLTALKSNNQGGGVWHFTFNNIRIQTLTGNQTGIYFNADDVTQGVDVANQYLKFNNVNVYKSEENSLCMKVRGQLGQTEFNMCEMNGTSNTKGWLIDFEPLSGNDNCFMPIIFENCTFQSCEKGIYAKQAHVIFDNCHVEQISNQFIQAKGNNSHIEFNNSNISGGIKPFRIEGEGTISGKGNTWVAPTGVACALEGEPTGVYLFDLDLYYDDLYICNEIPFFKIDGVTLETGYSKNIFINKKVQDIQKIKGKFKSGDILNLTNIYPDSFNIENVNFISSSNLYWTGNNVITLEQNQTASFIYCNFKFYLLNVQKTKNSEKIIKTKDIDLKFDANSYFSEISSGLSRSDIIGMYLLQTDLLASSDLTLAIKSNGNIWCKCAVSSNEQRIFTVRVSYLG